jgi:Immunity protein Imm1
LSIHSSASVLAGTISSRRSRLSVQIAIRLHCVDFEADRAKVTWLPDNTYGVELEPGDPITVVWYIDADVITIPAEEARVSTATVRRAVVEYVQTGQRPTCLSWEPQPRIHCVSSQFIARVSPPRAG